MVEYLVDPTVTLVVSGVPRACKFEHVLWDDALCKQFLNHLGKDGWIMACTCPCLMMYREKELGSY